MIGAAVAAALLLTLSPLGPNRVADAAGTTTVTVCSQNATYYYNILGPNASSVRAKLANPDLFGPAGAYGDYQFTYVNLGTSITQAGLDAAACDIYYSGYERDRDYTAAELSALQNWVAADTAHQVMAGCDSSSNDPVCATLGFRVTTGSDTYGFVVELSDATADLATNPLTCDGQLGVGDELNMAGGAGGYFSGPGVSDDNVVAVHETLGAPDPTKPIVVYTGNFLLTSDINMIQAGGNELTVSPGADIVTNNDILTINAFSALADVATGNAICSSAEPETTTDTDADGVSDDADTDDDNDGVDDADDAFPLDASESTDSDNDGVGDNADTDDDNDGQSDADETACGSDPLDADAVSPDNDGEDGPDCVDADDDNDGVDDADDAYPFSDLSPVVALGTCNSGVRNQTLGTGATFSDMIAEASATARNHGDFVRQVARMTNDWQRAGLIDGRDGGDITSCAARSK